MEGASEKLSSDEVWIEEIDNAALNEFEKNQSAFKDGFVRIMPYGAVFPRCFTSYEKPIRDFEVRKDDIFVASFPKCGTTWTQEMVWNICNDLDFEKAKSVPQEKRIPFLEHSGLMNAGMPEELKTDTLEFVTNLPRSEPRLLKTHLCYDMLPKQVRDKKPKVIYVTRNPRDAVVSLYNHWKALSGFIGILSGNREVVVHS